VPAALGRDDLLGGVIMADGTLIEGALDAIVGGILADAHGGGEFVVEQTPAIEGPDADAEDIGDLDIGGTVAAEPLGDAGQFRFLG